MATKPKSKSKSGGAAQKKELARRQIWAVVLFALGILFVTLSLISGQNAWKALHDAMFGLFGWCGFLVGPLLIYVSVMIALERSNSSILGSVIELLVLVGLICGLTQVAGAGMPKEQGLWQNIASLYQNGVDFRGGGLFSAILGLPLLALFGKVPAVITIILFIFVFFMLLTGTTLMEFFKNAYRPVKKVEEAYTQKVAQAREKPLAAPQPRFDIDLPVDDPIAPPKEERKKGRKSRQPEQPEQEDDQQPDILLPAHPVRSPKGSMDGAQKLLRAKDKLLEAAQDTPAAPASKRSSIDIEIDDPIAALEEQPPAALVIDPETGEVLEQRPPEVTGEDSDENGAAASGTEQQAAGSGLLSQLNITPDPLEEPEEAQAPEAVPENQKAVPSQKAEQPGEKPPVSGEHAQQIDALINKVVATGQAQKEEMIQGMEEGQSVSEQQKALEEYHFPSVDLLALPKLPDNQDISDELKANAARLVDTLKSFGVQTRIVDISRGPAVTRYELQPSAGVKISKITGLADDIALNLAAAGVRIEAPIPNKPAVGIEVPNKVVSTVSIREIVDSPQFFDAPSRLSVALGKDIAGNVTLADIGKMPHVLIAGSTGSGKSVCINSIIISLLFKSSPDEVKLLMVDPKVVELGVYSGIPHLLVPVVTDPRKAAGALNWAVTEMLNRYKLFADNSVRDLKGYNTLAQTKEGLNPMPQIVIIIDELADLMMAAPNDVEDAICRLAQMARAAGMHLVIATQRPSVDVITGVIKANIPSRIAFAVSSQVDSRTILDSSGAEKLLGKGDMLFAPVGSPKPIRVQGCFVSDAEVERVVEYIKQGEIAEYDNQIMEEIEKNAVAEKSKGGSSSDGGGFQEEDEMLPSAIEVVVEAGLASTSLLQRKLKLGYARAARLVDELEAKGIVGPFEGSKPRQVLISRERWLEMKMNQEG